MKLKLLIQLILLISLWTASYSQIILNNDQAKFFIKQDIKLHYLENDNFELLKKDTLNTKLIGNLSYINSINDSIINDQRSIIIDKNRVVGLSVNEIKTLRTTNNKLNRKVKLRNRAIIIIFTFIFSEAVFIYFTH